MDPSFTVKQAALRIGCGVPAVYQAIERGHLAATRRGYAWAITAEALVAYLMSDAELSRKTAVAEQRERIQQAARNLRENQRLAEIEARRVREDLSTIMTDATMALARFSAAVRRAQSTSPQGF